MHDLLFALIILIYVLFSEILAVPCSAWMPLLACCSVLLAHRKMYFFIQCLPQMYVRYTKAQRHTGLLLIPNPLVSECAGFSAGPVPCTRFYRFYWFMMAFELITILGAMITALTHWGLHHSRPFWIGMFSIATLLFMIASEAFLAGLDADAYGSVGGSHLARMRTAAAGAIMTVVANILLLLALGTDWEGRTGKGHHDEGHGGAHTGPHIAVTEPVRVAEPVGATRV